MNYTGIDYHKRYSVACTLDAQGRKLQEGRIDGNAVAAFAAAAADRMLLDEDLALHTLVQTHIAALEAVIATDNGKNPIARRLQTLPGVGQILAPVIGLEIDDITRFGHADKLCAYAELVPTTHASGGKVAHGRMLPFCNRWLKWAFIEAAWVAVGCSD